MTKNIQLIVGLGNPGKQYEKTRHNVGAWLVEQLCSRYQIKLQLESKFFCYLANANLFDNPVKIIIPTTYMNLSGQSVAKIAKYYKIPPEDILVVHDDLDHLPGSARLKVGGGHAGHNGLRDIISRLQSKEFVRLRIGIGHPGDKSLVSDFVLHEPPKLDTLKINNSIDNTIAVFSDVLKKDFEKAANILHSLTS